MIKAIKQKIQNRIKVRINKMKMEMETYCLKSFFLILSINFKTMAFWYKEIIHFILGFSKTAYFMDKGDNTLNNFNIRVSMKMGLDL